MSNDRSVGVMLDMETLSVGLNPAIIEMAFAAFDEETGELLEEHTPTSIPILPDSGDVDAETFLWWCRQPQDIKAKVLTPALLEGVTLKEALEHLSSWVSKIYEDSSVVSVNLWGNGSISDGIWLISAHMRESMEMPFTFRQHRDYRTLIGLASQISGQDPKKRVDANKEQHSALADCLYQVSVYAESLRMLKEARLLPQSKGE